MAENDWTTTSVKLERDLKLKLVEFCKREQITPNKLIKQLIEKKLAFMLKPGVIRKDKGVPLEAKQKFSYDLLTDSFTWKIYFENGEEQILSKDVSVDFLEKLQKSIDIALKEREQEKKKQGDKTVIPKDVLEYEVEE